MEIRGLTVTQHDLRGLSLRLLLGVLKAVAKRKWEGERTSLDMIASSPASGRQVRIRSGEGGRFYVTVTGDITEGPLLSKK